jgi:hypothetical protein
MSIEIWKNGSAVNEEIYINNHSLKDAVVHLAVVAPLKMVFKEGLVLTNHHSDTMLLLNRQKSSPKR